MKKRYIIYLLAASIVFGIAPAILFGLLVVIDWSIKDMVKTHRQERAVKL